jgi:mycofactocin precursor
MADFDLTNDVTTDDQVFMTERAEGAVDVSEDDELEELIIEDFTIDGICGVY